VAPSAASVAPAPSGSANGAPDLFSTTYPSRYKAPTGATGGTVIVADWQESTEFNPYYFNAVTDADVATATEGGLITSTDDFKYAPDEATTIPTTTNGGVKVPGVNGDAVTITWTLRDGLMWSDGTPLTCDDYKWTVGWIDDPANTGLASGKAGYLTDAGLAHYGATGKVDPADINLSVECASPTQMIWHMKEVYEGYLSLIPYPMQKAYNSQFAVKDMVTGKGWSANEVPNAPVSGPFKFQQVVPGQELDVVKNTNYKDHMTGGPAFLDGVKFKWYGDAATMIAAYQGASPEYDVAKDLADSDLPSVQGLQNVVSLTSLEYEFLRPNWDPKHCSLILQPARNGYCPMADESMRAALALAIDRQAIDTRLLGGNVQLAYTNTSPNAWFYVPPAVTPAQDLKAAQKILTAGNWVPDPSTGFLFKSKDGSFTCDGDTAKPPAVHTGDPATVCASLTPSTASYVRTAGEPDARLEACTTTRQVRQDTLAMVSGYLNKLGIEVTISPVSSAQIFVAYNQSTPTTPCALARGNADFWEHAFSVPLDPLSNYPVYFSTQTEPAGTNDAKVNDPGIDKDLKTVKGSVDFTVVKTAMADFQNLYIKDTIEVPLYFRKQVYLVNPKLMNFTGNPTSTGPMWNVQNWWFQQ
jgi:ABC-type transport system substrate-binding protein